MFEESCENALQLPHNYYMYTVLVPLNRQHTQPNLREFVRKSVMQYFTNT